jgi:hypothetical protein
MFDYVEDHCFFVEFKQKMQSQSLGQEEDLDLLSYIEFQSKFKAARLFHIKTKKAIKSFWKLLLEDDCDLIKLPKAFQKIDACEKRAMQYYKQLLERYPKSIRIIRSYAQFLEDVIGDISAANHYYNKAEILEVYFADY